MAGFVTEGYSLSDLRQLFGEKETVIQGWIERGFFGRRVQTEARIPERGVVAFLVQHHRKYDFGRLDQTCLFAMVFCDTGEPPKIHHAGWEPPDEGAPAFLRRQRRRQRP